MRNFHLLLTLVILIFSCEQREKKSIIERPSGWELVETPVSSSLRGLSPVTDNIVWASGSGGVWLRTLDGGISWETGIIDGLDSVDFRDIEAFNATTAVAVAAGQPAVIYKTKDGGKSWQKVYQGEESDFFDGVAFHKNRGVVYGDAVDGKWRLLMSNDQGDSWKAIETSPKAFAGAGSFAASGSGILVREDDVWFASGGSQSNIYHSPDKGMSWSIYPTPIIQGEASQGIFSITQLSRHILFAVGGDFLQEGLTEKNAMISQDDGKTWSLIEGNPPSGYRSGVTFFPFHHWLIAVGPNGSDFSKNGGHDWERFSEEGFHSVFLDKSQRSVWASGAKGKIAKLRF